MKNLKVWLAFELMDVICHFLLFTLPFPLSFVGIHCHFVFLCTLSFCDNIVCQNIIFRFNSFFTYHALTIIIPLSPCILGYLFVSSNYNYIITIKNMHAYWWEMRSIIYININIYIYNSIQCTLSLWWQKVCPSLKIIEIVILGYIGGTNR